MKSIIGTKKYNMNISAVIGLGFGDEGKGSFTQYLSLLNHTKDGKNLIIRFNGGHQAGHTTVFNKTRHVFSSFGSGSLIGDTTFWSKFCTVFPPALFNEYHVLKEKGITPKIIFDPMCPITTPYDVFSNKKNNDASKHGSVGVGFGSTIKRQEDYYKLHYQDLFNSVVLKAKLAAIKGYYENMYNMVINIDDQVNIWLQCVESLLQDKVMTQEKIAINTGGIPNYTNVIFEGAQGILLDMDHGFFPNVTRSNTTTKNIYTLMADLGIGYRTEEKLKIFYITRCYQTRHGNGFMSNEDLIPNLINTENEINVDTSYQGKFRKSLLDLDLLRHAITSDSIYTNEYYTGKKHIIISCVDQLPENKISYTRDGVVYTKSINSFKETLKNEFGYDVFLGIKEGEFDYKPEETVKKVNGYGYVMGNYGAVGYSGPQGTQGTQGTQGSFELYNPVDEVAIDLPITLSNTNNKGIVDSKSKRKTKYPTPSSTKISRSSSKKPVTVSFQMKKNRHK